MLDLGNHRYVRVCVHVLCVCVWCVYACARETRLKASEVQSIRNTVHVVKSARRLPRIDARPQACYPPPPWLVCTRLPSYTVTGLLLLGLAVGRGVGLPGNQRHLGEGHLAVVPVGGVGDGLCTAKVGEAGNGKHYTITTTTTNHNSTTTITQHVGVQASFNVCHFSRTWFDTIPHQNPIQVTESMG